MQGVSDNGGKHLKHTIPRATIPDTLMKGSKKHFLGNVNILFDSPCFDVFVNSKKD